MGRSYSEDLRLKVLDVVDCGLSKMQAHRVFRVSRSTIDDWLHLRAEQGHVQTKPPVRSRGGALGNACGFSEFVSRHSARVTADALCRRCPGRGKRKRGRG